MEGNSGRTKEPKTKEKRPPDWRTSEAKFLLREDIIVGNVTSDMEAQEVYVMRPCYSHYKFNSFRTNLRNLRKAVRRDLSRSEEDEAAYFHDKYLFGATTNGAWHTSDAYKNLKEDIAAGRNVGRKPKDLYNSRSEYKAFPLKKFRNAVYTECERQEKHKKIKDGKIPRFLRLQHDRRGNKINSSNI